MLVMQLSETQMSFTTMSIVVSSGVGGRGELSLAEVQCHLDKEGASDLVIDLIMNATSDRIFQESILLAIAMLEGGNPVIQVSRQGSVGCRMFSTNTSREGRRFAWIRPNTSLHKISYCGHHGGVESVGTEAYFQI